MSMKSPQGRRTPGSRDECRTAPDGRRPLDQTNGLEPAYRQLWNYTPIAIIINQPESWYSFYHPTEGGRQSQPRCNR